MVRAALLHSEGRRFDPCIPHTLINLSKNILYEDKDILVIDKPAGLVVHPDGRTVEPSVSEWFARTYPDSKNVGEALRLRSGQALERPGIVHRIDRETSGVLLLAKTREGHTCLKEQFQNREIEKIYHAFVYGIIKDDQGAINLPIARSASNFKKWSAQTRPLTPERSDGGRGGVRGIIREAITYFQVIKRAQSKSATFIEVKPKTGRTHQIRVHFQALHHPVVCDKLYGGRRSLGEGGCALGFERLALHARAITFKTVGGKKVTIEAPYPEDFQNAIKTLI